MSKEVFVAGGCFWGLERILSALPGVIATRVGYMGGQVPNPNYALVCTGTTGHAETVKIMFDPEKTSVEQIVAKFFENHDPTQVNRQGNDVGTQYRSAVWATSDADIDMITGVKDAYQERLDQAGAGKIATTIDSARGVEFWDAEEYHQKYLEKNPLGYCNHGFNGIACPSGIL